VGGSLALIVCGLLIVVLAQMAEMHIVLKYVFKWLGIIFAVLGAILVVARILLWIAKQIGDATGAGGAGGTV
jgi:hypothetical protein